MIKKPDLRLLFVINPGSGSDDKDWHSTISEYFRSRSETVELFDLPNPCSPEKIKEKIDAYKPDRVVAVGGDGTVILVAQCLEDTNIPMGILPAGSANGMAKELELPEDENQALDLVATGKTKKIHMIKVNGHYCIHLSDIGFNAFVVKKFESGQQRGMIGYLKASWKVLWSHAKMQLEIKTDTSTIKTEAAMLVLANATKYGSGALINPKGKLNDKLFEIVVIKKVSFSEIFKMMFTHNDYNPEKTELYQTSSLEVRSRKKVHFQVDGEYLGKVNEVTATILPEALEVVIPDKEISTLL